MMASGDYTYINDLDDGGPATAVMRRHEQSSSPLVAITQDSVSGSQSHYDYLDGSLADSRASNHCGVVEEEEEDVPAALTLQDFVDVDGSNLASVMSESNSVFDIGAGEALTQTQTPSVASQSVSGADFDTLPIAPMAKRPIEAPAAATELVSASTPRRSSGNGTVAAVRRPVLSINTATEPRQSATPFKDYEIFTGTSSPATRQNSHAVNFNGSTSGVSSDIHSRPARDTANGHHRSTGTPALAGGSGRAGAAAVTTPGHASKAVPASSPLAGVGAPTGATRPLAPPAPPPLHAVAHAVSGPHDGEGFSFGIDTFLHGNQLGFGRQPSFKRLSPTAQSESKRPYFLQRCEDATTTASSGVTAGAGAGAGAGTAVVGRGTGRGGVSPAADRNAEAFSTWLEALEPKVETGLSTTSRTGLGATYPASTLGENFKREVDVLMKNLLGDYDVLAGAAAAAAAATAPLPPGSRSASGVSPMPQGAGGGTGATNGYVDGMATELAVRPAGPGDSHPPELDTYWGDVRNVTPPPRLPATTTGLAKPRPKVASGGATRTALPGASAPVAPAPAATVTTATTSGSGAASGGKRRGGTGTAPSRTDDAATPSPPPPPVSGDATTRRRRIWSTSLGSQSVHGHGPAAVYGDVVPDPAATAAPTSTSAATATAAAAAAAAAASAAGRSVARTSVSGTSQPVVAMPRAPPRTSTTSAAVGDAAAAAATVAAATAKSATAKPSTAVAPATPASTGGTSGRAGERASPCSTTPYPYMDEDLLAGGYMTSPPPLIDSTRPGNASVVPASRSTAPAATRRSCSPDAKETARRGSSGGDGGDGGGAASTSTTTRGRRASLVDGHIGASQQQQQQQQRPQLLQQKLHPSWHNLPHGNGVGKASTDAAAAPPAAGWSNPYGRAVSASPTAESTAAVPSPNAQAAHSRGHGDHTLEEADETFLSLDVGGADDGLTEGGAPRVNALPLPIFLSSNNSDVRQGLTTSYGTAGAGATSGHLDHLRKSGSAAAAAAATTAGEPRRAARRQSAVAAAAVDPTVLHKERSPSQNRRQSVSLLASGSRLDSEDITMTAAGEHSSMAVTPQRRRLTEFRQGDYMMPASFSKLRYSATNAEDSHTEVTRQRDRDRQAQKANEERRQRIQAFMARRKAEKELEEQRRGQALERERQLESYREAQERQRIVKATPRLEASGTVGSGLNAIKASNRLRKSSPQPQQRERPSHPAAPAAHHSTGAAVVAAVTPGAAPSEVPAASVVTPDAVSSVRRRKGHGTPAKTNVRAVVVFTDSTGGVARDTSAAPPHAGATVTMELSEGSGSLKVQQPQERTRFFTVDEFLRVQDAAASVAAAADQRPANWRSGGGGGGAAATATSVAASNGVVLPRRLSSLTLTEMNRKFLAGVNVALLLACTESARHASLAAVREVVEGVLSHMPPQGKLFASVAFVANGSTQDLLNDPDRAVRSTFSTSPLFGPTLDGVTYVTVTGLGHLSTLVADAYKRCDPAGPSSSSTHSSAGLLVVSLLLKQQRGSDVILSSYLITDAGCDGGTYVAVVRKAQHTPFALFHAALGGPTLTTALMSVDAGDTSAVVPLLNVQHRLSTVVNKPCHVGSVQRFVELAQRELESRTEDESSGKRRNSCSTVTTVASGRRRNSISITSNTSGASSITSRPPSSNGHRGSKPPPPTQQQQQSTRVLLHKRLVEQVATARSILRDPATFHPKATRERRPSALSASAPSSASVGPPLSVATAPREQRRSVDAGAILPLVLTPPSRKPLTAHRPPALAAAAPATTDAAAAAGGVTLPSISPACVTPPRSAAISATEPQMLSPSVAASLSQPLMVPATRRPSDAPPDPSAMTVAAKTPLSPAAARAPPPIARFRPLQQHGNSSPMAVGRQSSTSISVSAEYVRRGADGAAAPHTTGFMNLEDAGESTSASVGSRSDAAGAAAQKSGDRGESQRDMPTRPASTAASRPAPGRRSAPSEGETSGRGHHASLDGAGGAAAGAGPTQRPLFVPPSVAGRGVGSSRRGLQAAPTRIGSNGPQWPSIPAMDTGDIPTVQSVGSVDSSFAHDVSVSARQSSTAYDGEKAPIPASTKVRTLVVVDPRCRETSNVTYDNTMVIATTEDDFEEYDVDQVREVSPMQKEPIQADLLTELCDTVLLGCNAAILGADSRPTGFSAMVLKSVVHTIFADMNREGTHRSGRLSASIVKVRGESVVDLLKDGSEPQKLVIAISPLFGSCVHGVTYANIMSSADFNATMDTALRRGAADDNGRGYGFVFCSLLFKLQLEEEGDVLVCSLVAAFAGEHVGLYTSVLDRSPLVPRALFHYALGGPSYTIALLGIGSEESRANQMLQVQRRLGEMSNRATHPGSVAKFVAGIRNDLTPNLIAKYEQSRDSAERAATKEMIERLAEMVRDADALLHDFDHHQPKAYLHEGQERQSAPPTSDGAAGAAVGAAVGGAGTRAGGGAGAGAAGAAAVRSSSGAGASRYPGPSNTEDGPTAPNGGAAATAPAPSRPAAQRALPSITAVNPESEGDRIPALVCYEQVLMGAGSVAVQGNSILCTSQGGMRYDSDEVIVCDEAHRSLSSKLMDQLVSKFLAGYHTGLLAADSSYSAFTPLMLRRIANSVLDAVLGREAGMREGSTSSNSFKPPTVSGELHVSIALIKDEVTADLLPVDVDATYHRFEMEHTPLHGPRLVGVTSHQVSTPQDFDHFLAVAIDNADPALQSADPGIMVVSLTLTQRVTKPVEDVLVSSLLCTAVFDAVHHYERVLEGNASEPLELFRNILRGPCFSVALFGISDEEEDPGKLLRALHGITQVRNRPPSVNSVARHIRELQRGVVTLRERMTTSSNDEEKDYILSRVKVAEHLLAEAEALRRNPLSTEARAFVPLGAAPNLRT
ncbi:hypothetical protein NESM_000283100 [Novymonas esmeraldas]|uniref:Uncharacterized protein n=1 Tax=Novymonas esmeraldas TaxID=1808958 RepID=A0AAW0FDT9_9TRYP